MSGATLAAYARWHAKESIGRALVPLLVFTAIVGIPIWELAQRAGLADVRVPGRIQDEVLALCRTLLGLSITLGALLVGSGFVAKDRTAGHVRFLFSTPVVPWQFYLQRFVIGFALYCGAVAIAPVGFSYFVLPVPVWPVVASAAVYGLLLGGLGMLAGSVTRHDGAVVIGAVLVGSILQQTVRQSAGQAPAWMEWIAVLLPPVDSADRVRTALLTGAAVDQRALALVLAWGAGMLLASLVVIRRAPLVR